MNPGDLNGKKICLLGYGREGRATHRFLHTHAKDASITICAQDAVGDPEFEAEIRSGATYLEGLSSFDLIIKSPGVPINDELKQVNDKITSQTAIFMRLARQGGAKIIGVTGSKGKSTTTSLIYYALKSAQMNVYLVGNIGIPAIDFVDKISPETVFVMEISSYQLEDLNISPDIAVLTSFFPEHLDRYGDTTTYQEAKSNITKHQRSSDFVFYNVDSRECKEIADLSPGSKEGFNKSDFPLSIDSTKLIGEHNLYNLAAAYMAALHMGVASNVALEAICSMDPLKHRLQDLGEKAGIRWINDSIASNPTATVAALDTLKDKVGTLLLGGYERNFDYSQVVQKIHEYQIGNVVLFPHSGTRIKPLLLGEVNIFETPSMHEAVEFAAKNTKPNKICLLSPGSPSFNLYKDFEARGEDFIQEVSKIEA